MRFRYKYVVPYKHLYAFVCDTIENMIQNVNENSKLYQVKLLSVYKNIKNTTLAVKLYISLSYQVRVSLELREPAR